MIQYHINLLKKVSQNPEYFRIQAELVKKYYDALIEAGFNKEQALEIVANQGHGINTKS